jgi:hypothetical protein
MIAEEICTGLLRVSFPAILSPVLPSSDQCCYISPLILENEIK